MLLAVDGSPARGRLRLWTDPDSPIDGVATGTSLEWCGRVGHPSSYVLLGGRPATALIDVTRLNSMGPFEASLAGRGDVVQFGLPPEFAEVVAAELGGRVQVTIAAHAVSGSSSRCFRQAARFLESVLGRGVPTEEEIWVEWERAG